MHVDQVALTAMSLSPKKTTLEGGGSGCILSNSDIGQSAGLSERRRFGCTVISKAPAAG